MGIDSSSYITGFAAEYMWRLEPQPTSAKWRSLTHRHIHDLQPGLDQRVISELAQVIFRWSSNVFLISGCTPNPDNVCDNLQAHFGEQVQRIASAVCKLAHVIKEDIMSTNFDIIAVDRSEKFDGKDMCDALGDHGVSGETVLCTTQLGLRCLTRKSPGGPEKTEGAVERRLLLRPRVLLESVADAL